MRHEGKGRVLKGGAGVPNVRTIATPGYNAARNAEQRTNARCNMTLWRFTRQDLAPALLILLLPLIVAMPQWSGWLKADPLLYTASMMEGFRAGPIRGAPYIDPNNGYSTQALGYRAAADWLQGQVPWWNPYSGVGLPLAAEYQAAPFFPLTFLLLLPDGMVWLQVALQILSGLGTYALLRQLGLGRLAATVGGLIYAFNGTLAWFAHASASPVPFLPWMLLGIERSRVSAALGLRGGWRLLAVSMALVLVSAFPETAYISGLLALAWAVLRGIEMEPRRRATYARRIALGGVAGIAIASPQVLAFLQFLPQAHLGDHGGDMAHYALPAQAILSSVIAPYAYGTIFAYAHHWPLLADIWAGAGGYVSVAIVALAAYGFAARRDALAWLLLGWCLLALAKSFGIEPAATLLNWVPGISLTAFFRYAPPSWELALVILAARGIDDWAQSREAPRGPWKATATFIGLALVGSLLYGAFLWPHLAGSVGLRNWAIGSAIWAVLTAVAILLLLKRAPRSRARYAIAAILVLDSALMFAIPTLSNPRGGTIDLPAVEFLRGNLGLQRFYTLGPIQPNYGAYFAIASINHNYLPVTKRWVEWMRAHLDSAADPIVFNGNYVFRPPGAPSPAQELRRNRPAYEWLGVKYVVAPRGDDPFTESKDVKRVYEDGVMSIFELPDPKPYFETASTGACAVQAIDRTRVSVDCPGPASLTRRELFSAGWTATVNGREAPIAEHRDLFQSLELPAGKSDVRYRYAPPHVEWAWLAAFIGLLALVVPARKP
jgi:hypothetical protein